MIYRLRVIFDNDTNEDILRDVEIDKNSNLTDLHELILPVSYTHLRAHET